MVTTLSKQIKKIRKEYGYKTQHSFADALGVHLKTVQGWENESNPKIPDLDSLLLICDKFDCDLDYLIGRIEEHKHDIKTVCELTNLSEKAVKHISEINSVCGNSLSHFLEQSLVILFFQEYNRFILLMERFLQNHKEYKHNESVNDDGTINLSIDQTLGFLIQQSSSAIKTICDSELYFRHGQVNGLNVSELLSRMAHSGNIVDKEDDRIINTLQFDE